MPLWLPLMRASRVRVCGRHSIVGMIVLAAPVLPVSGCGGGSGSGGGAPPSQPILGGTPATGNPLPPSGSRHKAGTVFIRGSVMAQFGGGLTLTSPTKGSFHVLVSPLTTYLEKKVSVSHTLVHVGTHIGVHGYLSGRTLKAVEVTVYVEKHPAKPKEHTVRGTVVGTGSGWINVALGAKQYHFVLAPGAVCYLSIAADGPFHCKGWAAR